MKKSSQRNSFWVHSIVTNKKSTELAPDGATPDSGYKSLNAENTIPQSASKINTPDEKSSDRFDTDIFYKKKEQLPPADIHSEGKSQSGDSVTELFSNNIIPDNSEKINTPDETPDEKSSDRFDTDYLSAVERGDMKTAQQMVDNLRN